MLSFCHKYHFFTLTVLLSLFIAGTLHRPLLETMHALAHWHDGQMADHSLASHAGNHHHGFIQHWSDVEDAGNPGDLTLQITDHCKHPQILNDLVSMEGNTPEYHSSALLAYREAYALWQGDPDSPPPRI